jgi:sulfur carrier protein
MIDIEVNGERQRIEAGTTLLELVAQLELPPGQALALAVNRNVVPRQQWPERRMAANDKIDIVKAIGGG